MTKVTGSTVKVDSNNERYTCKNEITKTLSCMGTFTNRAFQVQTDFSVHRYSTEYLLDESTHKNYQLIKVFDVVLPSMLEREYSIHIGTADHR